MSAYATNLSAGSPGTWHMQKKMLWFQLYCGPLCWLGADTSSGTSSEMLGRKESNVGAKGRQDFSYYTLLSDQTYLVKGEIKLTHF